MSSDDSKKAHGSRYVYEIFKGKAALKVAPGLSKTPKGQGFFLIMLVIMASLGAAGAAYTIDTCCFFSPAHPLQLFGVCSAPASLQVIGGVYAGVGGHEGCVITTQTTTTISGQAQVVNVQTPAGTFEYLNGSKAP